MKVRIYDKEIDDELMVASVLLTANRSLPFIQLAPTWIAAATAALEHFPGVGSRTLRTACRYVFRLYPDAEAFTLHGFYETRVERHGDAWFIVRRRRREKLPMSKLVPGAELTIEFERPHRTVKVPAREFYVHPVFHSHAILWELGL